jgi:hypothetical protein
MSGLWPGLAANLAAGTRLAFFLPVRATDFRISAGQYAMVLSASFAAWLLGGMARGGFPGAVNSAALVAGLGQVPLVLLACLVAATLLRDTSLALAFAVLSTSTDPAFEAVSVLFASIAQLEAAALYGAYLNWAFIAWGAIVLVRAQYVASGWRGLRSLGASAVFVGLLAFFVLFFPRAELWSPLAERAPQGAQGLMREDVFHLQGELLDNQLSELEPERPGVDDLYFVGAAPFGLQDAFIQDLDAAKRLMDERFDTAGRSLALVNHPATLESLPLATATNLSSALGGLGDVINPEEDIVVLFLATHGSPEGELAFAMPPLALNQVNPTVLARMLADSGIKWRVIVISACYSGNFIEPLKDQNTLIITASDATHASSGCEPQGDYAWFSRAYFQDALRSTRSFVEAFERARASVAERERAAGVGPSNPQMYLGEAMKEKLQGLERRLDSQDPGRPAVRASR